MPPPEQQKRTAGKPSLLSPTDTAVEEGIRILNAAPATGLRPALPAPQRRTGNLVALGLLVVAIAGALLVLRGPESQPKIVATSTTPPALGISAPVATARATELMPASAGAPASASAMVTESGAAIITEDAPPAKGGALVAASGGDSLTSALEAGIKPRGASLKSALEAEAAPTKVKAAAHAPLVNRIAAVKKTDDGVKPAKSDRVKGDSDVSLLAALVAHDTEHSGKAVGKAAVTPSKNTTLAQTSKSAAKMPVKSSETHHDAEPAATRPSSAARLKQCKTLDFVGAEMCRWRVCSGHWDTDAACKLH